MVWIKSPKGGQRVGWLAQHFLAISDSYRFSESTPVTVFFGKGMTKLHLPLEKSAKSAGQLFLKGAFKEGRRSTYSIFVCPLAPTFAAIRDSNGRNTTIAVDGRHQRQETARMLRELCSSKLETQEEFSLNIPVIGPKTSSDRKAISS